MYLLPILQQIPKRNIDDTFGYVKECENKNDKVFMFCLFQ